MRRLSNLSPFSNLVQSVFFSVDLFFRRRRPMNITGIVARDRRFHHIKTASCQTVWNTPLPMTIVRSYQAAMFVLHISRGQKTLKASCQLLWEETRTGFTSCN